MPELEAERQLAAIEAATAPHMEQGAQRETQRRYLSALGTTKKAAPATAAQLASARITVERVPKEVSTDE